MAKLTLNAVDFKRHISNIMDKGQLMETPKKPGNFFVVDDAVVKYVEESGLNGSTHETASGKVFEIRVSEYEDTKTRRMLKNVWIQERSEMVADEDHVFDTLELTATK